MKSPEPPPAYGLVGRRAVTVVMVAGLLILVLSNFEGGAGPSQPVSRTTALTTPEPTMMTVAAVRSSRASTVGLRMLGLAVTATQAVSYQAEQVMSWRAGADGSWLVAGASTVTVPVSHRTGQSLSGEFGLTRTLLALLSTHYDVLYEGMGSADGRPARIVEVLWPDGTVAARFWLDNGTMLPLRRQLFDTQSHLISQDDLDALKVGAAAPGSVATPPGGAATTPGGAAATPAGSSGFAMDDPESASLPVSPAAADTKAITATPPRPGRPGAGQLASLRAEGWPTLPAAMPGGLTLFDVTESPTTPGQVLDLAYSDGLSDVSVFVQRGHLPTALRNWQAASLAGQPLYVQTAGEPDLTWSAGGFVFTVVAGAPPSVIAGVVSQLPHQPGNGFWVRMDRGAHRLMSWVNPFR